MSSGPLNDNMLLMAGGIDTGANIANSCRFNDNDSARTTRTMGTGDGKHWTWSGWVKRANILAAASTFFSAGNDVNNQGNLHFSATDQLEYFTNISGVNKGYILSGMKFRDPTAWYHIVVQMNADDATTADRFLMWVNGVSITPVVSTTIENNASLQLNLANTMGVGHRTGGADQHFDGYLAEVFFLDTSTSYGPTAFGKFNAEGHWVPITPSGLTFGTNGFHQDYADSSDFGKDVSGNTRHFADSGLNTVDQRADTPTNNHCTYNSVNQYFTLNSVLEDGNLIHQGATAGSWTGSTKIATMVMDRGKWYWEVNIDAGAVGELYVGVSSTAFQNITATYIGGSQESWGFVNVSGSALSWQHVAVNTVFTDTGTMLTGSYVMVAFDADTGKLWFGLNGSWMDSGDPAAGTNEVVTVDRQVAPATSAYSTGERLRLRIESGDFEGSIPTGFKTLTVKNLSDANDAPIPQGNKYYETVAYSGNSTDDTDALITGLNFQPDLVWIKNRSNANEHHLVDSVRGVPGKALASDLTSAEVASPPNGKVTAFTSDGATLTTGGGGAPYDTTHKTGYDYVAWCWKMGTKPAFDIQLYVGTGVNKTEVHDLGVAPDVVQVKNRDAADNWRSMHMNTGTNLSVPVTDGETDYLILDASNAIADGATFWNDGAPTSAVFSLGTHVGVNTNTENYVAYLWADVAGYSNSGWYVGNGSTDGPLIWTGFRPAFVMIKYTEGADNWHILDAARADIAITNPVDQDLKPDVASVEATGVQIVDFLATGFKIRTTSGTLNTTSGTFWFHAFAEHPFKYARAF